MKLKQIMTICIILAICGIGSLTLYNHYVRNRTETSKRIKEEDERPMIGLSIDGIVIERWGKDINILRATGEELGFNVNVVNAFENADRQVEQIQTLINEGSVALIIVAHNKDTLTEIVEEAKKAGVIVVAYDRLIKNADVDAYVSFDNVAVGEYMAKALLEAVPVGNYVIINGAVADENSYMFNEGYYNILRDPIEKGDIKIIKEVWAKNWREEYAIETIEELLASGETIDGIIGANDRLAEGAISVLSEYGLVGKVKVVGHDADTSACQMIVEGKQLMTVYKPLKNLAETAMMTVKELLEGKEIDANDTIFDGKYDVPYVKLEVIPVNAENMRETVIKDLFQREEDVYRNID